MHPSEYYNMLYYVSYVYNQVNFTFRYIDDVLSLNNTKFGNYVERIYPIELEIKDTTDTVKSA